MIRIYQLVRLRRISCDRRGQDKGRNGFFVHYDQSGGFASWSVFILFVGRDQPKPTRSDSQIAFVCVLSIFYIFYIFYIKAQASSSSLQVSISRSNKTNGAGGRASFYIAVVTTLLFSFRTFFFLCSMEDFLTTSRGKEGTCRYALLMLQPSHT